MPPKKEDQNELLIQIVNTAVKDQLSKIVTQMIEQLLPELVKKEFDEKIVPAVQNNIDKAVGTRLQPIAEKFENIELDALVREAVITFLQETIDLYNG